MGRVGRRILLVSDNRHSSVFDLLGRNGWQIVEAALPVHDARWHRRLTGFSAGLLELDAASVHNLAALGAALVELDCRWLAMLPVELASDAAVRRFVLDYCADYVLLPCEATVVVQAVEALVTSSTSTGAWQPASETTAMLGGSAPMLSLFAEITKVARSNAPVFISGETGTGKELTAKMIHDESSRCRGRFVAVNCGAIHPSLIHSELFGHERGAFTGANERRLGRVEIAHGGTLFLDEIGDLPLDSQGSLLRFLQEGTIERLGSNQQIRLDVKVVSATHVDLAAAVAQGRFRMDLYHRLTVLTLEEPPLRSRGRDIELLARHMLRKFSSESRKRVTGFSREALAAMYSYPWPGNVRELMNCVRRGVVTADHRMITARDLGLEVAQGGGAQTLEQARSIAQKVAIESALRATGFNAILAAQLLRVSKTTLYRLCQELGIRTSGPPSVSQMADDRFGPVKDSDLRDRRKCPLGD